MPLTVFFKIWFSINGLRIMWMLVKNIISGQCSRSITSEFHGVQPSNLHFNYSLKFENHCPDYKSASYTKRGGKREVEYCIPSLVCSWKEKQNQNNIELQSQRHFRGHLTQWFLNLPGIAITWRNLLRPIKSGSLEAGSDTSIRKMLCYMSCTRVKNYQSNSNLLLYRKGNGPHEFPSLVFLFFSWILVGKNLGFLTSCPVLSLIFNNFSRRAEVAWEGLVLRILTLIIKCFHNMGTCSFLKLSSVLSV